MHKIQGFTLIEVMVTVAIVAILAAIGAPSLKSFMDANKVRAEVQRVAGMLSLARNHSVTNNQWVVVSQTSNAGVVNLIAFIDDGGDDFVYLASEDTLVRRSDGSDSNLDYGANTEVTQNSAVLFNAEGRLMNTASPANIATTDAIITMCDEDNTIGRRISINPIGRVSVSDLNAPATQCL